ncbi:unnamed protein product [Pedinophyceae sp. YPF-701]|nr:unnamed protein product [Pedinophyceae sp. YPF-701]
MGAHERPVRIVLPARPARASDEEPARDELVAGTAFPTARSPTRENSPRVDPPSASMNQSANRSTARPKVRVVLPPQPAADAPRAASDDAETEPRPAVELPEAEPSPAEPEKRAGPKYESTQHGHLLRNMFGTVEIDFRSLKTIRKLGQGAFGAVWLKEHTRRDGSTELLAVKELSPSKEMDAGTYADWLAEIQVMRSIRHPSIVEFRGIGTIRNAHALSRSSAPRRTSLSKKLEDLKREEAGTEMGDVFLAQEYEPGENLRTVILHAAMAGPGAPRPYAWRDAARWLRQVAGGLAYLHASRPQVIHRDVKCENLLTSDQDLSRADVKIADFGLSKLVAQQTEGTTRMLEQVGSQLDLQRVAEEIEEQEAAAAAAAAAEEAAEGRSGRMARHRPDRPHNRGKHAAYARHAAMATETMTGRTGSLMYMAPEVFRCEKTYNDRVDVFSWAMIAWELFAYRLRVKEFKKPCAEALWAYASRVANHGARPDLPPTWPVQLKDLLRRAWAPRASDRPAMEEVVSELDAMIRDGVLETEPEKSPPSQPTCCVVM